MADKFKRGDMVVIVNDNKRGIIQEKRMFGSSVRWKVFINQQEQPTIKEEFLELESTESLDDKFQNGDFLGLAELKRILSYIRIKGDVTNIYYSMGNRATEFLAHQFKPVFKFIESTTGKLLIADEVGLGKTIEAMYIWEELIARENSRRLLIVCPAALCEKWKKDISRFFAKEATIVDAKGLLENFEEAENRPNEKRFLLITSIEGIRFKEKDDSQNPYHGKDAKEKINDILRKKEGAFSSLLDLVVFDEAHNARNSETANYHTTTALRENANHVLLLSATPIQTEASNLFNLLKILDSDVFFDKRTFEYQLEEGQGYIKLSNGLRNKIPESDVRKLLSKIKEGPTYKSNPSFIDTFETNLREILADNQERIKYYELFAQKVFYSNYVTRTRKCDAFENLRKRNPIQYPFNLSDYERSVYTQVTDALQELASFAQESLATFKIIGRQRQMASCLPATILSWRSLVDSFFSYDSNGEILYEEDESSLKGEDELINAHPDIYEIIINNGFDYERLRREDSKYKATLECIRNQQEKYPGSKIVLFSFYRSTIKYLEERFKEDCINCISMMGGITRNKADVIDVFKNDPSITILLSTEVGAEGLDLQFCDTEINYDLPWNPMKLEQRIGRIDRIGQKSEKINIINMYCEDSVEDRVLQKLYERIDIFESSIGDLDEILGEPIRDIALILMNKNLTEKEKQEQYEKIIDTICKKKMDQENVEKNAANSIAFQELITSNIVNANKTQRYIRPIDLQFYVEDYLTEKWQGCIIKKDVTYKDAYSIKLSHKAAASFSDYLKKDGSRSSLQFDNQETLCLFDASIKDKVKRSKEVISYSHPLIKWITEERSNEPSVPYGCSSIKYHPDNTEVQSGMYVYYIQQWKAKGFKKENQLKYYVCNVASQESLEPAIAERIVSDAYMFGENNERWEEYCDLGDAYDALDLIRGIANDEYQLYEEKFEDDNRDVCEQQKISLVTTAARKIEQAEQSIETIKNNIGQTQQEKERYIKLQESIIKSIQERLENQIEDVEQKLSVQCENPEICLGLLYIE